MASVTLVSRTCATVVPLHSIASTSGLNLLPSQTGQGTKTSERNCISTRS